jgi:hypothetical protein
LAAILTHNAIRTGRITPTIQYNRFIRVTPLAKVAVNGLYTVMGDTKSWSLYGLDRESLHTDHLYSKNRSAHLTMVTKDRTSL